MRLPRTIRHRLEYLLFRLIVCLVDILPARQCRLFAEGLAFVVHRLLPGKLSRYHVSSANVRRALGPDLDEPTVDRIIYRMWVHLFRMVTEMVQLPRKMRLYNCADVMTFYQRNESTRSLSTGRPTIVLSGHFGNWEMAVAMFGIFGFPMGVVARDLDNPYLHNWFDRFRRHTGHRLISKRGGGREMTAFVERRGSIALLADQDAGPRGLFVDFFGQPASTFKSIALLAIEYDAAICVGYARRLEDDFDNCRWARFELGCEEVIDPRHFDGADAIPQITRQYTQALERAIRKSPEQYFWVHRRWKSEPRKRVRKPPAKRSAA